MGKSLESKNVNPDRGSNCSVVAIERTTRPSTSIKHSQTGEINKMDRAAYPSEYRANMHVSVDLDVVAYRFSSYLIDEHSGLPLWIFHYCFTLNAFSSCL